MTDWRDIGARRLGGPWDVDDLRWYGLSPVGRSLSVTGFGLRGTFDAVIPADRVRGAAASLPNIGFEVSPLLALRYDGDVAVTLTFVWYFHDEEAYYPRHWFERGLARCVAMCRILGPNELLWPEVAHVG